MREIPRQSEQNLEEEKPKEIKEAESFNELYQIINVKGEIIDDKGKKYTAKQIEEQIRGINEERFKRTLYTNMDLSKVMLSFESDLKNITESDGLRGKVSELVYKDLQKIMKEIPRQSEQNLEEEKPKEIKEAESFEELFEILNRKGEILGSKGKKYSAEEIIGQIKKVRGDNKQEDTQIHSIEPLEEVHLRKGYIEQITRTEGLRDKVSELLYKITEEELERNNEYEKSKRKGKKNSSA